MKDFDHKRKDGYFHELIEIGKCKLCGKPIIVSTKLPKVKRKQAKYCSNKCRLNAQKIDSYSFVFFKKKQ